MDLIEKTILKFNNIPGKIHGSLSFFPAGDKKNIIDFSSSCLEVNLEEIASSYINSKKINHYPDPDCKELKNNLSEYLGISNKNILITNGSSEALLLLGLAFFSKSFTVLLPQITYGEYERVAKIFFSKIEKIPLLESENFAVSREASVKALRNNPDAVFLCNPNNPTGLYIGDSILELFKKFPQILFVLDEAYIDFVNHPWPSLKSIEFKNVIILRSFTKAFGLAGLRLGYVVANPEIIQILDCLKIPWNVNYLASMLGNYLIENPSIFKNEIKQYLEGKEMLFNYFNRDYFTIPSETNYFLLKVKDSKMCYKKFIDNNILVRECSSFGLKNYIRINARKMDDCNLFLQVFEKIKGEISA